MRAQTRGWSTLSWHIFFSKGCGFKTRCSAGGSSILGWFRKQFDLNENGLVNGDQALINSIESVPEQTSSNYYERIGISSGRVCMMNARVQ